MDFLHCIHSIPGWLSDHEAWWLYEMARTLEREGDIVEIGSWKGKSTVALALGVRDGTQRKVIAVDPHKGELFAGEKTEPPTYKEFLQNLRSNGVQSLVLPIRKTSRDAARTWKKPIAMLFIDGLHDYKHAKEDFLTWNKFVIRGGIIAFHDAFCGMPGVWQAIDEAFLTSNISEIGTIGSIIYAVKGKPRGLSKKVMNAKITLLRAAHTIHEYHLPTIVEALVIHKPVRLLLLNTYTLRGHLV